MQGSTALKVLGALVVGALVGDVTTARATEGAPFFSIHGSACIGTKDIDRPRAKYSPLGVFNGNTTGGALTVSCPGTYTPGAVTVVASGRNQANAVAGAERVAPACKVAVVDAFGNDVMKLTDMKLSKVPNPDSGLWEAALTTPVTAGYFMVECGFPAVPTGQKAATLTVIRY